MNSRPTTTLEELQIRQAACSVILLGVVDTLLNKDVLTSADVLAVRRYALDLSRDMVDAGASAEARAAGVRIGEEVEAFMRVLVGLPDD